MGTRIVNADDDNPWIGDTKVTEAYNLLEASQENAYYSDYDLDKGFAHLQKYSQNASSVELILPDVVLASCRPTSLLCAIMNANQPTSTLNATRNATFTGNMAASGPAVKARQLAHLQSQLAQLSAQLADTDSLVRVTAAQAAYLRELGSWHAGLFMAASKVLGEDGARDSRGVDRDSSQ
ncbi:duf1721 domain containing protein [Grosmannia clavigera kw1407]|uniref:Duf1721 domain containing protein n=1 Tax=Grosmannia clavigera (strain kw1407 / UAMH 11150) TaxID=655863 RepID=F0XTC2_GROCL|nr:duf1721 domain containing protein [Grosmannia clavigera kw1407]EFW99079.1 duf1721 domain containing protein [Grosmannia clavigera kw1407]